MTTLSSPAARRPVTWRRRSGYWWIVLSAVAITVGAVTPYLVASLPVLAKGDVGLARNYVHRPTFIHVALYVHLTFAAVALTLSPLQFAARVRARFPRLHRAVGRLVLLAIVVGGVAGVVISTVSLAGIVGTAGFGLQGVLWVGFALTALRAIRHGDVSGHRRWMVRTFALTYGGVMLRLWMVLVPIVLTSFGMDDASAWDRAYSVMPFLCWVPNLVLAEWLLRRDPELAGRL